MSLAIVLVLRIRPGCLLWLAPVCGSWIFLCRGTTMRSMCGSSGYDALGDERRAFVRNANMMVSRCALLIRLAIALGIIWILEQPLSSLLIFHPRMQDIAKEFVVYQISLTMDRFGATTPKPTKLYSNAPWISELAGAEWYEDAMPDLDNLPTHYYYQNADGGVRVTGGPGLKETQTYTRRFGQEVRRTFSRNCPNKFLTRPTIEQDPELLKSSLHMVDGLYLFLPRGIYIYIYIYTDLTHNLECICI